MNRWKTDKEYLDIVDDILSNNEFKKLKDYMHHGDNRLDHSLRVSYYSYLISKKLKLHSESVARAGLLHDFFLVNNQKITLKERIKVLITHPKLALFNSKKYFELNELEENIIVSHMFPIYYKLPKHVESILVNLVDDYMSIYERAFTIKNSLIKVFKKVIIKTPIRRIIKVNN